MRNKLIAGLGLILLVLLLGAFANKRDIPLLLVKFSGFTQGGFTAIFMVENNVERTVVVRQTRIEIKTNTGWADIIDTVPSTGKPDSLLLISNLPHFFEPKEEAEWTAVIPEKSQARYRAAIDCARIPSHQIGWRKHLEELEDRVFGSPSGQTYTVYSAEFTR